MKKLLQIAAVLSFVFPFVAGVCILIAALSSGPDMLIAAAIGAFLVGAAFFSGGMLLVAAERLGRNNGNK